MKQKIILTASLILLLSVAFVSAVSFTTELFDSGYSDDYFRDNFGIDNHAYRINYNIDQAGWYLLPSRRGEVQLASLSEQSNQAYSYEQIHKAYDYRYALSPFTKKYVQCVRIPNYNPLSCDITKIYDESESYLQSLSEEEFSMNYEVFDGLSADWYYYSKPTKVSFDYHPIQINKLLYSKLKSGWNLITYPPHLGHEDLELGDCNIEKAYLWVDEDQEWFSIMSNLIDDDYSGGGVAIKVTDDCTFVKKKGSSVSGPPSIPN